MRTALLWVEDALYIIVGVLLLAAAVLVIVGTVSGLISSIKRAPERRGYQRHSARSDLAGADRGRAASHLALGGAPGGDRG